VSASQVHSRGVVTMALCQLLVLLGSVLLTSCAPQSNWAFSGDVLPDVNPRDLGNAGGCPIAGVDTMAAQRTPVRLSIRRDASCREIPGVSVRTLYGRVVGLRDTTLSLSGVGDAVDLPCACIERAEPLRTLASQSKASRMGRGRLSLGAAVVYVVLLSVIPERSSIFSDVDAESRQVHALTAAGLMLAGFWDLAMPSKAERELARLESDPEAP